jgi:uncharacterized protein (TIGR02118 family)
MLVEKLISVVRRGEGVDAAEFRQGFLARELPGSARARRRVVSIADCAPEDCDQPKPADYPAFDVAEELWFESIGDLEQYVREAPLPAGAAAAHHLHVHESVRKEERPPLVRGQRAPGVKQIYLIERAPGQTHEGFAQHWLGVHGPLAHQRHIGMSKYVQNVVLRQFPPSELAVDGIAELHFASLEDARTKRYDSKEGQAAISADRPNFVSQSVPLFASEYLVAE